MNTTTLQSGPRITQGHRKWHHSIAWLWFPITVLVTLSVKCTVFEIWRHIGRKSPKNLPHCHFVRSLGMTPCEFFDESYLARN